MTMLNMATILIPGMRPLHFDLDAFGTDVVRMGRSPFHGDVGASANDIEIPTDAAFVSRAQCSFRLEDGRWYLYDDHSKNGMIVDGRRTSCHELHDGDKIYIGEAADRRLVILFSLEQHADDINVEQIQLSGKNRFLIGRDETCDVVIRHPTVSRRHCVITLEQGAYYIADLNSTNGVLLNGSLLPKKTRLNTMDKVTIANTTLFFSDGCLFFNKPTGGVGVSTRRLYKKVGKGNQEKYITQDVTLHIEPNEFVAIIGGSGAGKTTLLNCLSGMTDFTDGEVIVNGESIRTASKNLRSLMGYVPQQDIVYDTLTLEKMLFYSAQLRMPRDTSAEEIDAKIDETLELVELTDHRKTMISKLSGGQKKRASIAVELLASPKLFFLDEPSSGLDPGTEKHLMQMLKRLANSGKTVIMVTHTVQNIDLCDRLICMGKGGLLCYSGAPSGALAFFGKERLTDIYDDLNENSMRTAKRFYQQFARNTTSEELKTPPKGKADIMAALGTQIRHFGVMTRRYLSILKNSPFRLLLLTIMPVVLSLLVCIAFQADGGLYNVKGSEFLRESFPFLVATDTMSLISAFSCAVFWVGIFNSVQEISKERPIYQRESFTGVRSAPYVLSKFSVLLLLCVVQASIMAGILSLLSSTTAMLNPGVASSTDIDIAMQTNGLVFSGNLFWLELYLTTLLCTLSAMCIGLAISAMVSNDMALVLCPICLLPQILFSGIASPLSGITETISKIISCRWSCVAYLTSLDINSMYESCENDTGWVLTEPESGFVDMAYASDKTYLFGLDPVRSAWLALLLICFVCLVTAIIVLRFRKNRNR